MSWWSLFFLIPGLLCAMSQTECLLQVNRAVAEIRQVDSALYALQQSQDLPTSLKLMQHALTACQRAIDQYDFILQDLARHGYRKEWRGTMRTHCEEKKQLAVMRLGELKTSIQSYRNQAAQQLHNKMTEGTNHFERGRWNEAIQSYQEASLILQALALVNVDPEALQVEKAIVHKSMLTCMFQRMVHRGLEAKQKYESYEFSHDGALLIESQKLYGEALQFAAELFPLVASQMDRDVLQQMTIFYQQQLQLCLQTANAYRVF
jgi:tetratricopeptide (TPR) repeat protein